MAASSMTSLWTDDETFRMYDVWGDGTIQAVLEGCRRYRHVYEKISRELEEAGYRRTWCQWCDKVKKLMSDYKKMNDYHGETGRKRKLWKFYNAMDDILGTRPVTQPSVVIDTSKEVDTCEPVQTDELWLTEENMENNVEEMIENELEYANVKETGEVNEND